eukprot:TRINITY_DN565_c0_g1_i1.p1 TRINITY_DN565_c0_g1~~TRINITY_DN565_c0_g1_i1.p1  ORF type:complete len:506 (-),score=114.63 TRINITY_DN565_c0_g1_i1:100-1617(-)
MSVVGRRENPCDGFFSMGANTLPVPLKLFSDNRKRLVRDLKTTKDLSPKAIVLLEGGKDQGICAGDSSDVGPIFKQEAYFHWAFGVLEPDCYGAIDVDSGKSVLFVPKLPDEYRIWMGPIPSLDEWKKRYLVDDVAYVTEMRDYLWNWKSNGSAVLLLLEGANSDSKKSVIQAAFDGISEFTVNKSVLFNVFAECRVIKSEDELEVLRYATRMSCEAHVAVMKGIAPGMMEYECEAAFMDHIYKKGGMRHVCYNCICGSGSSGAVLHYGHAGAPNDQPIRDGDIVLFDMGGEYYRFCSDVTLSYPANGVFTSKQKLIYNGVLRANRAVLHAMKPGVSYADMHKLANRVILEDLLEGGLLEGSVDEMMKINLCGRVFQPHGLGHFIGLDVHDVGGYLSGHPERMKGLGLGNLRTARVLKANMCLTIEPGCYFIDYLLDQAFKDSELSKFLVKDKIEEFRGFGGVRIEDDVIVTQTGAELMSVVPRTVDEIEAVMRGEDVKFESYKS